MQDKPVTKSYGMEDYSDIEPVSIEDAAKRGKRSVAIAAALALLMILFYVTTITRISENLKKRAGTPKKAAEIVGLAPVQVSILFAGKHLL